MFKIVNEATFTHAVTVRTPVDGGHREETFRATFRVLPVADVEAFNLMTEKGTRDFLQKAIVTLDELADETGAPLPYSDALRDQVIAIPYVRLALVNAYTSAVTQAKAGN